MANKTRDDIKNQIYEFLPQINQAGKTTLIDNCIDLAVEEISRLHDFRSLRATTPDEATLTTGSYYLTLDSSTFTTMMASTTYMKDILKVFWRKSTGDLYGEIKFIDDDEFHKKYGYYDYTSRSTGYPIHYTILNNRMIFNCPAYESLIIRCFYQKLHPPFEADDTEHSFHEKMNYAAFFAIVYRALAELKASLNSIEFPQDLQTVAQIYPKYIQDMIDIDKTNVNEEFALGWAERTEGGYATDPYDWA